MCFIFNESKTLVPRAIRRQADGAHRARLQGKWWGRESILELVRRVGIDLRDENFIEM